MDKYAGKPVAAVVEHVRDGTTLRLLLLPDMIHVTLMMSGRLSLPMQLAIIGFDKVIMKFMFYSDVFGSNKLHNIIVCLWLNQ